MSSVTSIYILLLQDGHYYIGKSDNPEKRFQQHKNGNGSSWTKKHAPISIEKIIKNASPFEEDKITKEYMSLYGINKVRGGSYSSIELSDEQILSIEKEIRGANDLCSRCGRSGHFVKNCFAKTDTHGTRLVKNKNDLNKMTQDMLQLLVKTIEDKKNKKEEEEDDDDEEEEDDEEDEDEEDEEEKEKEKEDDDNLKFYGYASRFHSKDKNCYRCGRSGHYSSNCYASKHIKGYELD